MLFIAIIDKKRNTTEIEYFRNVTCDKICWSLTYIAVFGTCKNRQLYFVYQHRCTHALTIIYFNRFRAKLFILIIDYGIYNMSGMYMTAFE